MFPAWMMLKAEGSFSKVVDHRNHGHRDHPLMAVDHRVQGHHDEDDDEKVLAVACEMAWEKDLLADACLVEVLDNCYRIHLRRAVAVQFQMMVVEVDSSC